LAKDVVEGWADQDLDNNASPVDSSADSLVASLLTLADQCADNEVEPERLIRYLSRALERLDRVPPGVNPKSGKLNQALPEGLKAAVAALTKRRAVAGLISRYRQRKVTAGTMDFADQAAWARRLTNGGPAGPVIAAERERFQAVVLDEFQDTSSSQIAFLAAVFGATPVMAVGDPNQSIYGWRGASADALDAFLERFQSDGSHDPAASAHQRQPDQAGAAKVLHLSVARRNGRAILEVANQLVAPLRAAAKVPVPTLQPLPEAGSGNVDSAYLADDVAEAAAVAAYLSRHWAPTLSLARPLTAAVLARTKRQLDPIIEALAAAGMEYQVIGRGGLLRTPEVQDIVAALAASHDLTRGDAFMRLATSPRFAIGAKDLDALARLTRPGGAESRQPGGDERMAVLDALETILEPTAPAVAISSDGLSRLRRLGRILRRIRRATSYLGLPELVLEAEQALDLDLDLLAAGGHSGRAQVNQLVNEAHDYSQGQDQADLAGFLGWLEAEDRLSDGLDLAEVPSPGGAVQLLTVHAAKGLEWDLVCVPGLAEGRFPMVAMAKDDQTPTATAWLSDANRGGASGGLPWPLRLDHAALPQFDGKVFDPSGLMGDRQGSRGRCAATAMRDHAGALVDLVSTQADAAAALVSAVRDGPGDRPGEDRVELEDVLQLRSSFEDFQRRAGDYFVREDRRVAYVAATRAKTHLLLTGSWYADGRVAGRPPSIFLEELAQSGLISRAGWTPDPGKPVADAAGPTPTWPPAHPAGRREPILTAAAAAVERFSQPLGRLRNDEVVVLLEQIGSELAARAALLIREQQSEPTVRRVGLPEQTSATALVGLTRQPEQSLRLLRRPLPTAPSRGSALGEEFHRRAAVELAAQSASPVLQDMLDATLLTDRRVDSATQAQLNSLLTKFRQSPWMSGNARPVAVEAELEIELLDRVVVARVDAVFREPGGQLAVVDWKTGRSDRGRAHPAHAEQLRLYQAAWARQHKVEPKRISGHVHYIMENLSVPVQCPPDYLEQLSRRISAVAHANSDTAARPGRA
jgi:DNA helicase-2/ATP-dependent DNA helicase PcrA